jgi:hypothetical protein
MNSAGRLAIGFTADFTTHHAPDRIRFARIWWLLGKVSDPESFEHDDWYQTEQRPVREANRDGRDG